MTYGVEHWGAATKKCLNQLSKLQKYAVRIIGSAKSFAPVKTLFQRYHILDLDIIKHIQILLFMYEINCGSSPKSIIETFPKASDYRQRRLRNDNNFTVKRFRLNTRKNSIFVRGPMMWNTLPPNVQNIPTKNKFKNAIKKLFTNV